MAREYTEKWHHTQQIFQAVDRRSTIVTRRLYHPTLETFLRALPYTFRDLEAVDGTSVTVEVAGDCGGVWQIVRRDGSWLPVEPTTSSTAKVSIPQDDAWKVFTKRRPPDVVLAAFPAIRLEGDQRLGRHALGMVSVMA